LLDKGLVRPHVVMAVILRVSPAFKTFDHVFVIILAVSALLARLRTREWSDWAVRTETGLPQPVTPKRMPFENPEDVTTCRGIYGIYVDYRISKVLVEMQPRAGLPVNDVSTLVVVLDIFGLSVVTSAIHQSELDRIWTAPGGLKAR
jgi:hypothetical protein